MPYIITLKEKVMKDENSMAKSIIAQSVKIGPALSVSVLDYKDAKGNTSFLPLDNVLGVVYYEENKI